MSMNKSMIEKENLLKQSFNKLRERFPNQQITMNSQKRRSKICFAILSCLASTFYEILLFLILLSTFRSASPLLTIEREVETFLFFDDPKF